MSVVPTQRGWLLIFLVFVGTAIVLARFVRPPTIALFLSLAVAVVVWLLVVRSEASSGAFRVRDRGAPQGPPEVIEATATSTRRPKAAWLHLRGESALLTFCGRPAGAVPSTDAYTVDRGEVTASSGSNRRLCPRCVAALRAARY